MTEKKVIVAVEFIVSSTGVIKGNINHVVYGSFYRDRKIVFIDGYKPEKKSYFEGLLPLDGEEWECEVVCDTISNKIYEEFHDLGMVTDKHYLEKYNTFRDPLFVGAIIVRLLLGGNLIERRAEAERLEKEQDEKLRLEHQEISDIIPCISAMSLKKLKYLSTVISCNQLFTFLMIARMFGSLKAREAAQKMQIIFSFESTSLGVKVKITTKNDYIIHEIQLPDKFNAEHVIEAIYAWIDRKDNCGDFYWYKHSSKCECGAVVPITKKQKCQVLNNEDVHVQCNFCGKNGFVRVHKLA